MTLQVTFRGHITLHISESFGLNRRNCVDIFCFSVHPPVYNEIRGPWPKCLRNFTPLFCFCSVSRKTNELHCPYTNWWLCKCTATNELTSAIHQHLQKLQVGSGPTHKIEYAATYTVSYFDLNIPLQTPTKLMTHPWNSIWLTPIPQPVHVLGYWQKKKNIYCDWLPTALGRIIIFWSPNLEPVFGIFCVNAVFWWSVSASEIKAKVIKHKPLLVAHILDKRCSLHSYNKFKKNFSSWLLVP